MGHGGFERGLAACVCVNLRKLNFHFYACTHTHRKRERTHTHTDMHVSRRGRHISSTGLPDARTIKDETPWIGYIRRWRTLKVAFIIVIYL